MERFRVDHKERIYFFNLNVNRIRLDCESLTWLIETLIDLEMDEHDIQVIVERIGSQDLAHAILTVILERLEKSKKYASTCIKFHQYPFLCDDEALGE